MKPRSAHRRESVRRSAKALRETRKRIGLCRCGRELDGFLMCLDCRKKQCIHWKRKATRNRLAGVCAHCGRSLIEGRCSYCSLMKSKSKSKLKSDVFTAYGNKCTCCGELEKSFLSIDHVNGGGNAHRKLLNGNFYLWLRKNKFPKEGFALLCFNCNLGRRINGGICPHKLK